MPLRGQVGDWRPGTRQRSTFHSIYFCSGVKNNKSTFLNKKHHDDYIFYIMLNTHNNFACIIFTQSWNPNPFRYVSFLGLQTKPLLHKLWTPAKVYSCQQTVTQRIQSIPKKFPPLTKRSKIMHQHTGDILCLWSMYEVPLY